MTEAFEDGVYLVKVLAQVMTRDDSTGGWVPMGGGGLSNVSVRKRLITTAPTEDNKFEYLIFGKRILDQSVVFSCTIKKDFEYNKVMPTFHHWKTGDKKFGLTFNTAADARAFDKGVRIAVEELLDGRTLNVVPTAPSRKPPVDIVDDDVFMALDLPVESRSSSDSSGGKASVPPAQPCTDYSYVQLTDMYNVNVERRDSTASLKKKLAPPVLLDKVEQKKSCVATCIDTITCVSCLDHCIDSEDDICSCSPHGDNHLKRWAGLALLSLFIPCLCLNPPLRACHRCCTRSS
nr:PREDICTED: sprouty-related, EVH1 domain-containing protein 2 isoform X1 [Bemisia tabaci]